jgi:hypothetical protein
MPPGLGSVMPSHRVLQQRQVSQKLRRNLRAARIWVQPMRTPWANDIWARRSSAAMPRLPDPSGVAGVSVSAGPHSRAQRSDGVTVHPPSRMPPFTMRKTAAGIGLQRAAKQMLQCEPG